MPKLLITGHKGFIGSYIFEHFRNKYQCFGVSKSTGVDISKYTDLDELMFSPNIIIHAAASLDNDLENSLMVNVMGSLNICKFAKKHKIKHLILISSISIFDNSENEYYNNYGMTKKQSEEIIQRYCNENNINLTTIRLSQVYDTKRKAIKSQKMLYSFIDNVKTKQAIYFYGNKNPKRNYIHIKDVLTILEEIIETKKLGAYNVINDQSHTIKDVMGVVFSVSKLPVDIRVQTNKQDILSVYIPTTDLYDFKRGYIDLEEGIREIIEYE